MAGIKDAKQGPISEPSGRMALLLLGLVVAGVFFASYMKRLRDLALVQAEIPAWEKDVAWARARNAALHAQLEHVASDEYVAQVARSELGLSQPGDEVFVVLGNEAGPAPAAQPAQVMSSAPSLAPDPNDPSSSVPSPDAGSSPVQRLFDLEWWRSLFHFQPGAVQQ